MAHGENISIRGNDNNDNSVKKGWDAYKEFTKKIYGAPNVDGAAVIGSNQSFTNSIFT